MPHSRVPAGFAAARAAETLANPDRPDANERTVIAADPPSAAQPDAEWLALARDRRDLVRVLVLAPQMAEPALLLRSVTCNPRDLWLAPCQRRQLADAIDRLQPGIRQQADHRDAAFRTEFAAAMARGLATPIDLARYPGEAQTALLGRAPIFHTVDGALFGVRRVDMPSTAAASAHLHEAGLALLARVVLVFADAGALSAAEAAAATARAATLAREGS